MFKNSVSFVEASENVDRQSDKSDQTNKTNVTRPLLLRPAIWDTVTVCNLRENTYRDVCRSSLSSAPRDQETPWHSGERPSAAGLETENKTITSDRQ